MSLKTNNFSAKLKVKAPEKPVHFRRLGVKWNEARDRELMSVSVHVKNFDSIIDPETRELVAIECVASQSTQMVDGVATIRTIRQDIFFYRSNNGYITIAPGSDANMNLYQYLMICNANASNPNRSKVNPPLFELVDHEVDAKTELEKEDVLFEARLFVKEATFDKLKELAPTFKLDVNLPEAQLRLAMNAEAKSHPTKFIFNSAPDATTVVRTTVEKAVKLECIKFNSESNQWININKGEDSVLLQVEVVDINDPVGALVTYLFSESMILGKLNNKIKKKEKE